MFLFPVCNSKINMEGDLLCWSVLMWEWAQHPHRQGDALLSRTDGSGRVVGPQLRVGLRKRPARQSCPAARSRTVMCGGFSPLLRLIWPLRRPGTPWEEVGSQDCLPWNLCPRSSSSQGVGLGQELWPRGLLDPPPSPTTCTSSPGSLPPGWEGPNPSSPGCSGEVSLLFAWHALFLPCRPV